MSLIKTIVSLILIFSLLLFVALFGSLPVFRKTPIAFLNRLIWHHIPRWLRLGDKYITGGRVTRYTLGGFRFMMYEKHPTVLVFFIGLQVAGEVLLIPPIAPTLGWVHWVALPVAVALPYYFLYKCATVSSAVPLSTSTPPTTTTITTNNNPYLNPTSTPPPQSFGPLHAKAMHAYPYDYLLFHPGYFCSTCRVPKPARSKHCSLCKMCIQKADHHCIWINNCVGRNNYVFFLMLLVCVTLLLAYGVGLSYGFIDALLQRELVPPELTRGSMTKKYWRTRLSWGQTMHAYTIAMVIEPRVVATGLLCAFCVPLSMGFLVYHAYLIWAGMTTNESGKWAEWKEDVGDGLVWRARLVGLRGEIADGGGDGGRIGGGGEGVSGGVEGCEEEGLEEERGGWLPREIEPRPWDVAWPPEGCPEASAIAFLKALLKGFMRWATGRRSTSGSSHIGSLYTTISDSRRMNSQQKPQYWYIRTRDGVQPMKRDSEGKEVVDERWEKVRDMRREVENVYDLGVWRGLWEVVMVRD